MRLKEQTEKSIQQKIGNQWLFLGLEYKGGRPHMFAVRSELPRLLFSRPDRERGRFPRFTLSYDQKGLVTLEDSSNTRETTPFSFPTTLSGATSLAQRISQGTKSGLIALLQAT